jgi:hypothetical protein
MAESDIAKQDAKGSARRTRHETTLDRHQRGPGPRTPSARPVPAGAAIAAIGLTVGSLTAASAAAGHGGSGSIEQQAAKVKAEDAFTPTNGNAEMNVTVLEDQIKHYYGSASATFPVVGTVTVPSPDSNYAKQMQRIVANAEAYLAGAIHHQHGKGKPAVVFDIDGTLLNTYDYEIANQFGFTRPATPSSSTPRRSRRCSTCRNWSASRPATATRSSSSPADRRPRPTPRSRT